MKITLTEVGKRFNRDWIFRNLNYEFVTGHAYAITGPNGSGKSTLLQLIAGSVGASEGTLNYQFSPNNNTLTKAKQAAFSQTSSHIKRSDVIPVEEVYKLISLVAPYLELIEEMTLMEFLQFHQCFKPFLPGLDYGTVTSMIGLESSSDKQIRYFSSGMKQRVKLAQAIFADTPIVLLDEPCTNLDGEGIALYRRLIEEYGVDRLIIVSSNDTAEYQFCDIRLDITEFKK